MDRWNDSLEQWHAAHRAASELKNLVFQAEVERAQGAGEGPTAEQLEAVQAAVDREQALYESAMKALGVSGLSTMLSVWPAAPIHTQAQR